MNHFFSYSGTLKDRRRIKYAVVVYLPQALNSAVAPLREQFDPLYNLVPPHITIVFPFEINRPLDELASLIKAETDRHQSFLIELNTVGDFYPQVPIIYWSVKKNSYLSSPSNRVLSWLSQHFTIQCPFLRFCSSIFYRWEHVCFYNRCKLQCLIFYILHSRDFCRFPLL